MTTREFIEVNLVITKAFRDPYPPELVDKEGKRAWREEHVKLKLVEEFSGKLT